MKSSHRLDQILALMGVDATISDPLVLKVEIRRNEWTYRGQLEPDDTSQNLGAPMSGPNPEWKWLSPTEEAVLKVMMAETEWKSATQLAELSGLTGSINERDFGTILRNLVERRILESSTGKGYRLRLKPINGMKPENNS